MYSVLFQTLGLENLVNKCFDFVKSRSNQRSKDLVA